MKTPRDARRRTVALVTVLAMLFTACGSDAASTAQTARTNDNAVVIADDGSSAESDDSDPAPVEAPTVTAAPVSDDDDQPDSEQADEPDESGQAQRIELGPADWDGLTSWNLPAMGGLTFGVPDGTVVVHDGDMVAIRTESDLDSGELLPTMIIARVYQTPPGLPMTAADMTSSAIADVGAAAPTNLALSFLDQELDGWEFTADDDKSDGPFINYSAHPLGASGPSAWGPFPLGNIFLADVPGGVLAVGWRGKNADELAQAKAIFDRVAPTIELARPFDETSDAVTAAAPEVTAGPPDPVALPEGWPAALTGLSAQVSAGEYSHAGFGTAFSFAVDEGWWVQPNFPGWLVLTGDDSSGPGDRDIVFRSGADRLVPALRSGVAGDGHAIDVLDFVENPPENIVILNSGEVTVGGATGFRVRFEFDSSADCAAFEVCEYLLMTASPFPPASIRTGYQHELWHLDGGLAEPITILVGSPDERWFDRAQELFDTIEFDR